jgi:Got1/Sft2-like family
MSKGFGQWYEEKKAEENGENVRSGSLSISGQLLPLFDGADMSSSWSSVKASMESQMPKQILGMSYQQRFKVFCGLLFLSALFFGLAFFVGLPMIAVRPQKFALSFTLGSLTFMGSFGVLKGAYACARTSRVRIRPLSSS